MKHRYLGRHMVAVWADGGFWGLRYGLWQIDVRDHRRCPPLFSARELGRFCGHHFGTYCLRAGRLTSARRTT